MINPFSNPSNFWDITILAPNISNSQHLLPQVGSPISSMTASASYWATT